MLAATGEFILLAGVCAEDGAGVTGEAAGTWFAAARAVGIEEAAGVAGDGSKSKLRKIDLLGRGSLPSQSATAGG